MDKAALVDWGTSSFRLWLLKADDSMQLVVRSNEGMSEHKTAQDFETTLERHLIEQSVRADLPVMVCGMAGARQGWAEAKYVSAPAKFEEILKAAISVIHPNRVVRILPGVAQTNPLTPDVMRGEETQLLGASKISDLTSTVCMPGTHSKWVTLKNNSIVSFSSFMTGEIFGLLSNKSTLAHSINDEEMDLDTFDKSAMLAFEKPELTSHELFSVRAAPLLKLGSMNSAKGKLSGLLIGLEMAGAKRYLGNDITLLGTGKLAELYSRMFELLGVRVRHLDADEAVSVGLRFAAKKSFEL